MENIFHEIKSHVPRRDQPTKQQTRGNNPQKTVKKIIAMVGSILNAK